MKGWSRAAAARASASNRSAEPVSSAAGEELEGDLPIQHEVIGEAHLAHAPLAEAVDNPVASVRDHVRRHDVVQNTPYAAVASVVAGRRNSPLAVYSCGTERGHVMPGHVQVFIQKGAWRCPFQVSPSSGSSR